MMPFKTALGLLFLALLAMVNESLQGNGKGNSYSYDLSKMSELRKLYNSKVFMAELFTRPLEGLSFQLGPLSHSGVRVTLEDGTKWLVHKGKDFGISSQTIVVDGRHMSSKWKIKKQNNFHGSKTVSDFVHAGGANYNFFLDNCHNGSGRMMKN